MLGFGCVSCALCYGLYALLLGGTARVYSFFVPISMLSGLGIGLTVATWSSAGLSDIPQAKFGVASATYNTLRQASYAIGIAVAITLIAAGSQDDAAVVESAGYRWAYLWVAGCYLLSGLSVMATFPPGSSTDRSASPAASVE